MHISTQETSCYGILTIMCILLIELEIHSGWLYYSVYTIYYGYYGNSNTIIYYHIVTCRWKGENVSTQEVGSLISDLDIIEDCSVYGVSIPGMDGKCGMSAIVLKTGISPTPGIPTV